MIRVVRFRQTDKQLFADIKSGRKTVETRAATKNYANLVAGDSLKFVCGQETTIKKIIKVNHFSSIDDLFKNVPVKNVMPEAKNIARAKKIYYSFPGYQAKISQLGLIAFYLK